MEIKELLLDTNAYTAFKKNDFEAVAVFKSAPNLYLSSIVLGELQSGFAVGNKQVKNQQELEAFLQLEKVSVLTVDEITANYYAKIYKQLRETGHPIPTNDMWIAAIALQHDLPVFTYDKHFSVIDGLVVGNAVLDFA
jgi:predicted nucleic acid-binding protein